MPCSSDKMTGLVNLSLAINGNERFVWEDAEFPCNLHAKGYFILLFYMATPCHTILRVYINFLDNVVEVKAFTKFIFELYLSTKVTLVVVKDHSSISVV